MIEKIGGGDKHGAKVMDKACRGRGKGGLSAWT